MEWVCSDLHLNHDKSFIYETRGFNSIQEHDEIIVQRWNEVVRPCDEVWFLGDIGMGKDIDYLVQQVSRLNGTIHWIRGNHCTENRYLAISELENIYPEGWALPHKWGKQKFWLSHFPAMTAPIGEKPFNKSLISLCGHSHTADCFADWGDYMIYHVELEAHNCYPVSFEQIMNDIRNMCEAM